MPHPAIVAGPSPRDAFGIGLVLVLIGAFLLANSVLLRHPRDLVSEHFGGPRRRLVTIRGLIFHRLQSHLGFLFLLIGFSLQLYGHYGGGPEPAAARAFPTPWMAAVVLAVIALELGGWWLSHALFLRHVREHFRAHPPALENDLGLARELGELFGITSDGNDSVQSYLLRIRRRIGLSETRSESSRTRTSLPVDVEGEAEEGFV